MDQSTVIQGLQFDTSLALRGKVLSLYSLDTNTDAVISEAYHHRCKFVDPIVSTRGHREVKAQFRSLRAFLRYSKAELVSSHYDVLSSTLTMDTTMVFKPKLWPFSSFRLKCFTVVVVDADGLVRSHTDHWSVASLLETKIGWMYRAGRRLFGAATSLLFGWLTKDSTPLVLAERVPTAPPVVEASSLNSKSD
ncbi:unnamed protein product [Ectocarpus fasciculatus]